MKILNITETIIITFTVLQPFLKQKNNNIIQVLFFLIFVSFGASSGNRAPSISHLIWLARSAVLPGGFMSEIMLLLQWQMAAYESQKQTLHGSERLSSAAPQQQSVDWQQPGTGHLGIHRPADTGTPFWMKNGFVPECRRFWSLWWSQTGCLSKADPWRSQLQKYLNSM